MFKHNWAWIKLATDNFSTVLTRNLRNPRDCAPLNSIDYGEKLLNWFCSSDLAWVASLNGDGKGKKNAGEKWGTGARDERTNKGDFCLIG